MQALEAFLAEAKEVVDRALETLVPPADAEPRRLHEALRWSLFGGGKRVRPALTIAVGRVFGAGTEDLVRTAAAIEMIHTYSLIHDDLPAMDDDDLRRGRATCHRRFDEATAILAGDVLQTLAFQTIAEDDRLSFETRTRLVALIAASSGSPGGMVAGQQMDLGAEGRTLTRAEIENIHSKKTGALIRAAALGGAIIGGADAAAAAAVRRYSECLGLLFQITDDVLDVTQPTETLGKTAGKDPAASKATYPSVLGLDEARRMAERVRNEAVAALAPLDGYDVDLLRSFAGMVLERTR